MAGNAPKFKVGDLIMHVSVKKVGIGTITKVILGSVDFGEKGNSYSYGVTWSNGQTNTDPEYVLTGAKTDEICVAFEGRLYFFPAGTVDPEVIFNKIVTN